MAFSYVPDKLRSKFRFLFTGTAAEAAGTVYHDDVFNVGDLNDMGEALASHQPIGFDDLKTLYGNFVVTNVKIVVHARLLTTDSTNTVMVLCVVPSETARTGYAQLGLPFSSEFVTLSQYEDTRLALNVSSAELFGKKKEEIITDNSFWGTNGTGPTRSGFLHVFFQSTVTTFSVLYTLSVEVDTLWFNRALLADALAQVRLGPLLPPGYTNPGGNVVRPNTSRVPR